MVARTTPARRAISDMLLSGSLAKASRAASRIEATLRSASARRLRADAFVAVVVFAISLVTRHRAGIQSELWHEVARSRQHGQSDQAADTSEQRGRDERMCDA